MVAFFPAYCRLLNFKNSPTGSVITSVFLAQLSMLPIVQGWDLCFRARGFSRILFQSTLSAHYIGVIAGFFIRQQISLCFKSWNIFDIVPIEEHYINGDVINRDRGFGIAATAEDPERLVQLLDTLLSDEWQILLQWGVEGEDYTVENGRMLMNEEQYKHLSDAEWKRANKAEAIFTSAPKKQGTMDDGNAWDPTRQPEIRTANEPQYDKDLYAKLGIKAIEELFNPAIELAPYGEAWQIDKEPIDTDYQKWLAIQMEWLPKIITCDPSEIDANFAAFQAEIKPYSEIYANFMHEEILKQVYPERYE